MLHYCCVCDTCIVHHQSSFNWAASSGEQGQAAVFTSGAAYHDQQPVGVGAGVVIGLQESNAPVNTAINNIISNVPTPVSLLPASHGSIMQIDADYCGGTCAAAGLQYCCIVLQIFLSF